MDDGHPVSNREASAAPVVGVTISLSDLTIKANKVIGGQMADRYDDARSGLGAQHQTSRNIVIWIGSGFSHKSGHGARSSTRQK